MGAGAGLAEGRGPALLRGEARCRSRQHPGLLGPGPGWTVFPFLPRLGRGGGPVSWGGRGERGRAAWDPPGLIGRRLQALGRWSSSPATHGVWFPRCLLSCPGNVVSFLLPWGCPPLTAGGAPVLR